MANVAVELAGNIFGELGETRILLVGAGEIGEKTARAFQSRGARSITVCSRRLERAAELAKLLDAVALPFEHREHHLAQFDIVVSATSAPETVISKLAVDAAMRQRPAQPLLLIDLALPRDIEPEAASEREHLSVQPRRSGAHGRGESSLAGGSCRQGPVYSAGKGFRALGKHPESHLGVRQRRRARAYAFFCPTRSRARRSSSSFTGLLR